jgi:sugar lactone lactonase YvrE
MTPVEARTLRQGLLFPEGPRWHDGRLWVSDQHAHQVLAIDGSGSAELVADFDDMPSGLGWLPDGTLVVALMRSRRLVRVSGDSVTLHADLSSIGNGYLNDMVIDGAGRAYVGYRDGRYGITPDQPGDAVALVDASGAWRVELPNIQAPNGSVVTPDGREIIIAETRMHRLSAWSIDPDGSLRDQRVFAQLDRDLLPDGICLDAEGAVWAATLGSRFVRVAEGGRVLDAIDVTGGRSVACTLGGHRRATLFMLVTDFPLNYLQTLQSPDDDRASTSRGRIDTTIVTVSGAGWP